MKRLIFILSIITIVVNANCQKTLRYSGDFYNGMRIKGEANYSYYLGNNNEQIKNGSFRYSSREKNEEWRYSSSITGNFNNNLRQGLWAYNIESKDFEKSRDGFYYNISISLIANYLDGKPNGVWHFKTLKSQHKKELKQNRWRIVGDTIIEDVSIDLHWKNGVLIDSINIVQLGSDNILAILDNNGFVLTMDLQNQNSSSKYVYSDQILDYSIVNNQKEINYEYQAYKDLNANEKLIDKKKRSLILTENCKISSLIENYIFKNPQFLNNYIDGDLTILQSKIGNPKINIKGLYYYELSPILTGKEQEIVKEFQIKYGNIKQADWLVKTQLKKSPKDKYLIDKQRNIKNALNVYNSVNCHILAYKKYLSLHNTLYSSDCNSFKSSSKISTKIDFLEELKTITDKQYKILQINNQI